MKQIIAIMLAVLLLCSLGACAARNPSDQENASAPAGSPAETQEDLAGAAARENTEPAESSAETQEDLAPSETQTEPQTEPQTDPEPTEIQTETQPQNEPEAKTVSLTLPFMETEDFFSFQPEDGAHSAGLSLEIPADWTEDAGLFYCPGEGGVRKVLEPICLLRDMDDAQWEKLARFDVTGAYGETEYLSVTPGVDAKGREYIQLLGKCWPEGGDISVWYPCTCFLRDTSGTAAVLTCYLLDPEDQPARAELQAILDSLRLD